MGTTAHSVSMHDVYVTILAGGSGTRLWPLSRQHSPKQTMPLFGERSLLQQTYDRVRPLVPAERICVLTGPDHAELIGEQLPEMPRANLFIEPSPRGTAPCLGLAALRLARRAGSAGGVMVSLHADHVVRRTEAFQDALRAGVHAARQGYLTTIGIVPSRAETGFGYIERAEAIDHVGDLEVYAVGQFREKPPLEVAERYLASGRFYWNTGYFCWTLQRITDEFRRSLPDMCQALETLALATAPSEADSALWDSIIPTTIDVGIMERAERVAVVPAEMGWDDVGSWASVHDLLAHDAEGNAVLGGGPHIGLDTADTLIYSPGRMVATIGLQGMIVVDTGDAILVLPRDRAQDVGRLVRELQTRGLRRYL